MKTQKRDLSSRTFQRGYRAGITGKSKDNCPHTQINSRNQWLSGWREGREAQWDAHTGIAGLHRQTA